MYRNLKLLVAVAMILAVAVGTAHAIPNFSASARYLGMGDTGIALADDVSAVDFNPANLGVMSFPSLDPMVNPDAGKYWAKPVPPGSRVVNAQVMASSALSGAIDLRAGYARVSDIDQIYKKMGLVIGWKAFSVPGDRSVDGNDPETEQISVGYGHQYFWEHWAWGVSFAHAKTEYPTHPLAFAAEGSFYNHEITNSMNVGGLFWFPQKNAHPIRAGIVVQDMWGNNDGPIINLGGSMPLLSDKLTVALDYNDLFSTAGSMLNVGAEYAVNRDWRVRIGDANLLQQQDISDVFTAGVGWVHNKYKVDLCYLHLPEGLDAEWAASGSYSF